MWRGNRWRGADTSRQRTTLPAPLCSSRSPADRPTDPRQHRGIAGCLTGTPCCHPLTQFLREAACPVGRPAIAVDGFVPQRQAPSVGASTIGPSLVLDEHRPSDQCLARAVGTDSLTRSLLAAACPSILLLRQGPTPKGILPLALQAVVKRRDLQVPAICFTGRGPDDVEGQERCVLLFPRARRRMSRRDSRGRFKPRPAVIHALQSKDRFLSESRFSEGRRRPGAPS